MAPQQRQACPSTQVVQHRLLRRTLRLRALVLMPLVPLLVLVPLLAMLLPQELKPKPTPQHSQMLTMLKLKLVPAR